MVRMQDVAEVMGVSTATVSNAFSRPDQLSPELRDRILARAAKMGYTGPNAAARALRNGRSNAYGVVFIDTLRYAFTEPFTMRWLTGFADAMEQQQANVLLMTVPHDRAAAEQALRTASIDGLAVTWGNHPIIQLAQAKGLAVVGGGPFADTWISIDEGAAGRALGNHVRALGHRDVCLLVGPGHDTPEHPAAIPLADYLKGHDRRDVWPRIVGVLEALDGLRVTVLRATRWDRVTGERAAALALDRPQRPTAIVALSDNLALGALDAMRQRGIVPGRHLTLTGFDDIPEAETAGLTTIHQPAYRQGHTAAEILLDPQRSRGHVILPHELVVRRSSAPITIQEHA